MVLGDGLLQNGDLELGKFEPYQFRTLYTHISQIMQTKIISANKSRTGLHLDTNIERTKVLNTRVHSF